MQKRDRIIFIIAIVCGLLAFMLVLRINKKTVSGSLATTSPTAQNAGLSIPAGMRALTLSEKNIENTPDSLTPGSYVDILGFVPDDQEKPELQTIIRSAQVIAMKNDESGAKLLTMTLTPQGAEVVSKAMGNGKIRLILRPDRGENSVLSGNGSNLIEVIRGVDKEKK